MKRLISRIKNYIKKSKKEFKDGFYLGHTKVNRILKSKGLAGADFDGDYPYNSNNKDKNGV